MSRTAKVCLLLVLVVVAAIVWVPQLLSRFASGNNFTRYPLGPHYYCESCGFFFAEAPGRLPPLKCPKCRRASGMRTIFGPGASGPEFIRCKQCRAEFPSQLWKWSAEDKARWEKRLGQLHEGQFLSSAEVNEMAAGKQVKTSTLDWTPWPEFQRLPAAEANKVRCPKCGNTDPDRFDYAVRPPGAAAKAGAGGEHQ